MFKFAIISVALVGLVVLGTVESRSLCTIRPSWNVSVNYRDGCDRQTTNDTVSCSGVRWNFEKIGAEYHNALRRFKLHGGRINSLQDMNLTTFAEYYEEGYHPHPLHNVQTHVFDALERLHFHLEIMTQPQLNNSYCKVQQTLLLQKIKGRLSSVSLMWYNSYHDRINMVHCEKRILMKNLRCEDMEDMVFIILHDDIHILNHSLLRHVNQLPMCS